MARAAPASQWPEEKGPHRPPRSRESERGTAPGPPSGARGCPVRSSPAHLQTSGEGAAPRTPPLPGQKRRVRKRRRRLRRPPALRLCPVPSALSSPPRRGRTSPRVSSLHFAMAARPGCRPLTRGAERREKEEKVGARSEKETATAAGIPRHLGKGRRAVRQENEDTGAVRPTVRLCRRSTAERPPAELVPPPARPLLFSSPPLSSPPPLPRARQVRTLAPGGGGGAGPAAPSGGKHREGLRPAAPRLPAGSSLPRPLRAASPLTPASLRHCQLPRSLWNAYSLT